MNPSARPLLHVLVVEDSEIDARVLNNLLRAAGWHVHYQRVETPEALAKALAEESWDLILSDHNLPQFSAPQALEVLKGSGLDIPFIIVSGEITEGVAIGAMDAGAHDFLTKGSLGRLAPAVARELREARVRAARRDAEQALRESELRYRSVWENSTDAVLLVDLDGVVRFANPAVQSVFGRAPSDVVGLTLDALQPPGLAPGSWWTAATQGGTRVVESAAGRPDGSLVPVEIAFTDMATGGQRWVVAFARDISLRLAQQAELVRNREQFAAAREIQQRLFPHAPPHIPGLEFAGASNPAESAGGDYFDYLPLPGGAIGLVVADVSGHGVASAMLMAEARAYLRLLSRDVGDPGLLLTAANRALSEDLGKDRYITMVLVRVDPVARRIQYASAGHPEAILFAPDGRPRASLRRTGPPLGRRPDAVYVSSAEQWLEPGDSLLLVTDGIDEALDPTGNECFGMERAGEVVRACAHRPAADLVRELLAAVRAHSAPKAPDDDLTTLVMRVAPAP